ncbi:hypothetical protein NOG11_10705 [Parvularcula sp. BGMRC 0090]|uniref:Uncharacterized protein n=2 Tax=Parvularcula maris TaxID=2965077 RepID=A0A9X2LA45_9PROT|nr:hypothetical protein [Parvularcula maris]
MVPLSILCIVLWPVLGWASQEPPSGEEIDRLLADQHEADDKEPTPDSVALKQLRDTVQAEIEALEQRRRELREELEKAEAERNALISVVTSVFSRTATDSNVSSTDDGRDPKCIAATAPYLVALDMESLGDYLTGANQLSMTTADRQAIAACGAQQDAMALFIRTLDRTGRAGSLGPVDPLWLFDTMVLVAEGGEIIGLMGATLILNLYWSDIEGFVDPLLSNQRTLRGHRISRYEAQSDRYLGKGNGLGLAAIWQRYNGRQLSINNECYGILSLIRNLTEENQATVYRRLQSAPQDYIGTCREAGVPLYVENTPAPNATWATGMEAVTFRSGGRTYSASDVAALFDDWQEFHRRSRAQWRHPDFIQFVDDDGNNYLAGFDALADPRAAPKHYTFRITTIDAETIQTHYKPMRNAIQKSTGWRASSPNDFSEDVLWWWDAMDPGFRFLTEHFAGDGRPPLAVTNDIVHMKMLEDNPPFHELSARLETALEELD